MPFSTRTGCVVPMSDALDVRVGVALVVAEARLRHQLGEVLQDVLAQGRVGVLLDRQRRGRVRAMEPDHAFVDVARELGDLARDVDELLAFARLHGNGEHAEKLTMLEMETHGAAGRFDPAPAAVAARRPRAVAAGRRRRGGEAAVGDGSVARREGSCPSCWCSRRWRRRRPATTRGRWDRIAGCWWRRRAWSFDGRAVAGEVVHLRAEKTATMGALVRFSVAARVGERVIARGEMTFAVTVAP